MGVTLAFPWRCSKIVFVAPRKSLVDHFWLYRLPTLAVHPGSTGSRYFPCVEAPDTAADAIHPPLVDSNWIPPKLVFVVVNGCRTWRWIKPVEPRNVLFQGKCRPFSVKGFIASSICKPKVSQLSFACLIGVANTVGISGTSAHHWAFKFLGSSWGFMLTGVFPAL